MGLQAPTPPRSGWPALFRHAFRGSRNAMVLLDAERRHVDINSAYLRLTGYRQAALIGQPVYEHFATGPLASDSEWRAVIRRPQFTGTVELVRADGHQVNVEFAGYPESVTGEQLILFVVLRTTRRGAHLRPVGAAVESSPLTPREREVIELVASGLTGPEIAEELSVSHHTVRNHVSHAMTKLGARSRAHLVAKALGEVLWQQAA